MAVSPLLIAFLILFPLVQVPAVLYLSRYLEMDSDAASTPPAERYWDREGPDSARQSTATPPGGCPECGAENDPSFRFCGRCAARLSG